MIRRLTLALLLAVVLPVRATAQPPGPPSPSDHVLLTVVLKHDQSKTLEEINKIQDESGFWAKFPPDGIQVESWYVVMGLGQVVTLRVPPARLREVNRSIELTAWKAFRSEVYAAYDFREAARAQRERALKK